MLKELGELENLEWISENQNHPLSDNSMTPKQQQVLKEHLQAIAKILHDDSDPTTMQNLEGIEMTLRQQIQKHVSPELRGFYRNDYRNPSRQIQNPKKHIKCISNYQQTLRSWTSIICWRIRTR